MFEIAGQIILERMSQVSCIKKSCIPAIQMYISNSHKITATQYPSNAKIMQITLCCFCLCCCCCCHLVIIIESSCFIVGLGCHCHCGLCVKLRGLLTKVKSNLVKVVDRLLVCVLVQRFISDLIHRLFCHTSRW